ATAASSRPAPTTTWSAAAASTTGSTSSRPRGTSSRRGWKDECRRAPGRGADEYAPDLPVAPAARRPAVGRAARGHGHHDAGHRAEHLEALADEGPRRPRAGGPADGPGPGPRGRLAAGSRGPRNVPRVVPGRDGRPLLPRLG